MKFHHRSSWVVLMANNVPFFYYHYIKWFLLTMKFFDFSSSHCICCISASLLEASPANVVVLCF